MAWLEELGARHFTLLIYGWPKIGKTILASQFPNAHMLDLDDGISAVKSLAREQGKKPPRIKVIQVDENPTEDPDFIELCGKPFVKANAWTKSKAVIEKWAKKLGPDDTLVVDNTSALSDYLLDSVNPSGTKMEYSHWNTFVREIRYVIGKLQNARANVVIVAHEQYNKDDGTGELHRTILMPTNQKYRIPGRISDLLYMKAEVSGPAKKRIVKRYIESTPDYLTPAGSRALIPDIEDPTFEKIRPYLEATLGRSLPESTWTPN